MSPPPKISVFRAVSGTFLHSLHTNSFCGLVFQAGGNGDAVVGGALKIAPICVGDGLHHGDLIGSGAVDGGIGDDIARLEIFDGTDIVPGPSIVATHSDVSLPAGGGAVVAHPLGHAGVGFTLPHLHADAQLWDGQGRCV